MKKKCVIVKYKGIAIAISEIVELEPLQFVEKRKECDTNLKCLLSVEKEKISKLDARINELENQIKILKGEE